MKHKKSVPVQKKSSSKNFLTLITIGLAIIVLFFVLSGKDIPSENSQKGQQLAICSEESYPVCGKDGKTYTNSCTAEKIANIRVAYVGKCREEKVEIQEPIASIEPESESGTEVDSGIQYLESVPKYMTDRESTGSIEILSGTTETLPTLSGATIPVDNPIDPTLLPYFNNTYRYGFSMPKNSYYQAFGAQNGASHSVGITTGTGIESFTLSEVRVYFYANHILPELSGGENGLYIDSTTHTVSLLLNQKDSVVIESNNEQSELVQTILRTIHGE